MKVRKFTEEEIQYIIESYKTDSLQKIADNLKTSKKKIKEELIKQNIELSDHRKREDKDKCFEYSRVSGAGIEYNTIAIMNY